jgi:hypothetical protein
MPTLEVVRKLAGALKTTRASLMQELEAEGESGADAHDAEAEPAKPAGKKKRPGPAGA